MNFFRVKVFILSFLCTSFFLFTCNKNGSKIGAITINAHKADSIISLVKNTNNTKDKELLFEKTFQLINNEQNDSLQNKLLINLAYTAYIQKTDSVFLKYNAEAKLTSIKQKDTVGLGEVFWHYGSYFLRKEVLDSSFYYYNKAVNQFQKAKHKIYEGRMLFNMALVQKNARDYTGSEITTYNAIVIFNELGEKYRDLYKCYNNLGIVYHNTQEFDKAIEAHEKALENLDKVKNRGTSLESSLNNIGLVYQKSGNHIKAIEYFKEALANKDLRKKNQSLYAKLIDNLAYNRFLLGDTINVHEEYLKSLSIRDSLNFVSGILMSKLHLSEYYALKQDTTKAIAFAQDAHEKAKSVDNFRDQLVALQLLSKFDEKNSGEYLNQYVQLNGRLQDEERATRNKFTRISFETDEHIDRAEKLSREKSLITIIGVVAFLLVGSIFIIRLQRARNKRLLLEQDQQNDREQIYQLVLEQQSKMEEGRLQERTRISEELHDGILGKMFGARMGLGFLEIKGDKGTKEKFDELLNEMLKIEKEVRAVSHALQNEILSSRSDFMQTINAYIEKLPKNTGINVSLHSDPNIVWEKVSGDVKISFFRVIQETYYNTLKYAKANNFKVSFSLQDEMINLDIEDDGIGFNTNKAKKGIGLKNMKNRIENLNGTISILSSPNKGTKVSVSIKP